MNRWDYTKMLIIGAKLFNKIYKSKRLSHHNNEIHFLFRDKSWLIQGIQSLIDGCYNPRFLKRIYFPDERVDYLHQSDRVLQHVLLKVIKPTIKYVFNPNCYHIKGPHGVKEATDRISQSLKNDNPKYFIRADIKSYYKSILHHKLIDDIKSYYDDPKLITMLKNIITNPIETPFGDRNPHYGIALRGPLSTFFSGLYLKPLDDSFDHMEVSYLRYQDDILILCKTKRQMNRCRRRLMNVLHERGLKLSRKKTRYGAIELGFHFLGVQYPSTRTIDNTHVTHKDSNISHEPGRIVPHPRTIRNAREQVKCMVADEVSLPKIKSYLVRWSQWWARTSCEWSTKELIHWYLKSYRKDDPANSAAAVFLDYIKKSNTN